jgi:hypothetical protein
MFYPLEQMDLIFVVVYVLEEVDLVFAVAYALEEVDWEVDLVLEKMMVVVVDYNYFVVELVDMNLVLDYYYYYFYSNHYFLVYMNLIQIQYPLNNLEVSLVDNY